MTRGEPHDRPDAVIDSDPDTLARVLVEEGRLTTTGDTEAADRLFDAVRP
ncbi:hypothetical protein [Kribbella sp. NBC_00889]|nr:hypothetical protein OG817_16730 [Kribbella sp. NBC_00889]